MIVALFALVAAMIIGGVAAVIQGFPYVRLESGLAMVIAGSIAASAGAVLLGLAVVAMGLRGSPTPSTAAQSTPRTIRTGRLPRGGARDASATVAGGRPRRPAAAGPARRRRPVVVAVGRSSRPSIPSGQRLAAEPGLRSDA